MKRYQKTVASQYIVVSLLLVSIISTGFLSALLMRRIPFEDAFIIPWAAGRAWLLEAINPYEAEVAVIAANAISDSKYLAALPDDTVLKMPFLNLIFYLPFSLIPYAISRILWSTLLAVCIFLIGYFSFQLANWRMKTPGMFIFLLFSLLWVPGITAVIMGKLHPLLILLLFFSVYLFLTGQDTTAGFILSLVSGSLTWSLLLIVFMLVYAVSKRRWSVIFSYFSGLAFIIVISILLLPSWPRDWLRIVVDSGLDMNVIQTPLVGLSSLLPGIEDFLSIFLHALFGVIFVVLLITTRAESKQFFIWNILSAFIIAYLVNIQGSLQAVFLILPGIFLVFRYLFERWGLIGKIFSFVLIIILSAGSWVQYFPFEYFSDPVQLSWFYVGLPILAFIGMLWIRWWALKIPRLPFETQ